MARYLYALLGVALAALTIWCARITLDTRSVLDFVVTVALGVGSARALGAARARAKAARRQQ